MGAGSSERERKTGPNILMSFSDIHLCLLFFPFFFERYSGPPPISKWLKAMSHIGSQAICKPRGSSWSDTLFCVSAGQFVNWGSLFYAQTGAGAGFLLASLLANCSVVSIRGHFDPPSPRFIIWRWGFPTYGLV